MYSATPKQSLTALWLWRGSLVPTICLRTRVLWISWPRLRTRRSWRRWICFGCLGCRGGERDWRGLPDLMRSNERIRWVIDSVMEGLARCWRCLLAWIAGLERDVRERGFYSWVCFSYPQAFSDNGFIFSVAYIAFEGFSLPIFEELHAQHTKHLQLHLDVQLWLYYSFTYLARMFHNQPHYSDSQICLNNALSHQSDRESRPNKP
jgi:hypothetical protein